MSGYHLNTLEEKMGACWADILARPMAEEIQKILASGDKKLYGLWLAQVAHLTQHTSAHQAMVGTRFKEISYTYMRFCYEHALEEVGHEMMAINDLKKLGLQINNVSDLPPALPSTEKLNAYLYYAATKMHPNTRLGFSFWAEKCYPFIQTLASTTKDALGLGDHQMTFFVSHSTIDEKHAEDVEEVVTAICKTEEDWKAVENGMTETLEMAINIFEEIFQIAERNGGDHYKDFLSKLS